VAAQQAKQAMEAAHEQQLHILRQELALMTEESTQAMQEQLERERADELELRQIQVIHSHTSSGYWCERYAFG
jgi:maleate cis-trans isomerase